jgi:hypothetical protein
MEMHLRVAAWGSIVNFPDESEIPKGYRGKRLTVTYTGGCFFVDEQELTGRAHEVAQIAFEKDVNTIY